MTEISKLYLMLCEADIPCDVRLLYDGWQLLYPSLTHPVCDVIFHSGSYGYDDGLLEIMGLVDIEKVGDEVEGYLDAEEIFKRIEKYHKSIPNNA